MDVVIPMNNMPPAMEFELIEKDHQEV